ncbi:MULTISPECIES: alpha/beta fold hydrolase [unclassified Mycobacterium]|uniref:alpha/beta hydrolase n=1 Tax=unclassified Mycobacterium TaxID=2642494 RepID=UPI001E444E0B
MGHGGSATKRLGLPAYAEKFTAAGLAVLAFDYRHFGASGGEPRQVIDVDEQRDDYRAAVRYARGRDDIDPRRVALWGTSLSGGHVLAVAADDPDVAAVGVASPADRRLAPRPRTTRASQLGCGMADAAIHRRRGARCGWCEGGSAAVSGSCGEPFRWSRGIH